MLFQSFIQLMVRKSQMTNQTLALSSILVLTSYSWYSSYSTGSIFNSMNCEKRFLPYCIAMLNESLLCNLKKKMRGIWN